MKFSAASLLIAAIACVSAHDFSKCKSLPTDHLGVQSVQFTPEPPKSGEKVDVTVKGQSLVDITGGEILVDVRVLGISVGKETFDVCEVLSCPVKAGEAYEGTVSQMIPEGTPSHMGATVRLSLADTLGKKVSCLESYVEISGSTPEGLLGATQMDLKATAEALFAHWKVEHPKVAHNFEVFTDNLKRILKHNADAEQTFTMAMNEFGSMTREEFAANRLGLREPNPDEPRNGPLKQRVTLRSSPAYADPPESIDWTTKGVVSEVKNQGSCGSCWAFSAIGSLESAYAIKHGKLIEFSEQELVSCDTGDYGCQGGLMDSAFDWIERSTHGLCTEEGYAYTSGSTSARGECKKDACEAIPDSVPSGYYDILPNEAALAAAVAEHGPVSVAIEADQAAFQFYHSGVMSGACGNHLDHGVLLVGYGFDEESGKKFWKVKNSWGAGWGEEGYIRMLRGKRFPAGGECGIASKASYPIFGDSQ